MWVRAAEKWLCLCFERSANQIPSASEAFEDSRAKGPKCGFICCTGTKGSQAPRGVTLATGS